MFKDCLKFNNLFDKIMLSIWCIINIIIVCKLKHIYKSFTFCLSNYYQFNIFFSNQEYKNFEIVFLYFVDRLSSKIACEIFSQQVIIIVRATFSLTPFFCLILNPIL